MTWLPTTEASESHSMVARENETASDPFYHESFGREYAVDGKGSKLSRWEVVVKPWLSCLQSADKIGGGDFVEAARLHDAVL